MKPTPNPTARIHRARLTLPMLAALLPAILALAGCTWRTEHKVETVHKIDAHIVLDIRQIKEEATTIEDYVRPNGDQPNGGQGETQQAVPAGDKTSYLETELALRRLAARGDGSWLSFTPAAHAQPMQAADAPVGKDDERKAIEGRKARAKQIEEALNKSVLGENNRGYVEALLPKDADKDARAAAEALAKAENADRRTVYRAVAQRQEGGAAVLPAVEAVFAEAIREQLKKGQMFQAPKEEQAFETFKQSAFGKAHPDAKPGGWVRKAIDPPKKN
jgi:uncharacterized protein YdbL (DUF1318 family)